MLTPKAKVWKVLKEVKKTVPQIDMYKQSLLWKHKVPRSEANSQPLAWQTWDASIMLPGRHRSSDKLTTLFKPYHARCYGRTSFEIKRLKHGSIATCKQ